MNTYLGIDIGGTAVKLGLVAEGGEVLLRSETSVSFDGYRTPHPGHGARRGRPYAG